METSGWNICKVCLETKSSAAVTTNGNPADAMDVWQGKEKRLFGAREPGMFLVIKTYLVPMLGTRGVVPSFPHTSAWRSAYMSARSNFNSTSRAYFTML
jgi:hypothetical protein